MLATFSTQAAHKTVSLISLAIVQETVVSALLDTQLYQKVQLSIAYSVDLLARVAIPINPIHVLLVVADFILTRIPAQLVLPTVLTVTDRTLASLVLSVMFLSNQHMSLLHLHLPQLQLETV